MILVDDQSGSKDLFPYIQALTDNTVKTRIYPPYGDIVWAGNGPDNFPLTIAVEYKTIDDIMKCVSDGRFAGHQVEGLVNHYDRRYLLVEGRIRTDRRTAVLQKLIGDEWVDIVKAGRPVTFGDLERWYTTMEEMAQFRVVKTFDKYESARWVVDKYKWWAEKGWKDHKALCQFHVPPPPTATFTKPSLIRRIAKELFKVGWDKSIAVEAKFKSVREMINANEQTWSQVDGIGKTISAQIVKELREEWNSNPNGSGRDGGNSGVGSGGNTTTT